MSELDATKPMPLEQLKELLKIKFEMQTQEVQNYLKNRRKLIADKFYSKDTPQKDKDEIFDELTELHKYFGYKLPFKRGQKQPVSIEQKKKECEEFWQFCNSKSIYPSAEALAQIWVHAK
jgi:hypothetical protein